MKNNFGLYRSGCPFFGKSWFAYFFSPNWYSSLAYCLFSMNFHYFQLISVTFFAFLKSQSHTSKYWWITAECAKSAVEFIQTYWSDENKIQNIREIRCVLQAYNRKQYTYRCHRCVCTHRTHVQCTIVHSKLIVERKSIKIITIIIA